ncbi:tetratricopeptide repeat protein [Ruegeria arenilitoris]|uniref:tetratricopeptide repeat protein n=1 Tax=Ruegeria arenilitoris TaxID=1173585 RepID=UPI00147A851B|nr:tetratricopeptide repeat protein [Ruegeria arenilitoris]
MQFKDNTIYPKRLLFFIFVLGFLAWAYANHPLDERPSANPPNLDKVCGSDSVFPDAAIEACTVLLSHASLDSERMTLLLERAWAFKRAGKAKQAIDDIDQAISIQGVGSWESWVLRAHVNAANGDYTAAESDFAHAQQAAPNNIRVLEQRARLELKQGKLTKVLQSCTEILATDPGNTAARELEISTLLELGEFDLATERLVQLVELVPDHYHAYRTLGLLYFHHKKNRELALSAFSKVSELSPAAELELIFPAMVHLSLGNEVQGTEYIEKFGAHLNSEAQQKSGILSQILLNTRWSSTAAQNQNLIFEGIGYALAGRPDLAKSTFQYYREIGGQKADALLSKAMKRYFEADKADNRAKHKEDLSSKIDTYVLSLNGIWSFENASSFFK